MGLNEQAKANAGIQTQACVSRLNRGSKEAIGLASRSWRRQAQRSAVGVPRDRCHGPPPLHLEAAGYIPPGEHVLTATLDTCWDGERAQAGPSGASSTKRLRSCLARLTCHPRLACCGFAWCSKSWSKELPGWEREFCTREFLGHYNCERNRLEAGDSKPKPGPPWCLDCRSESRPRQRPKPTARQGCRQSSAMNHWGRTADCQRRTVPEVL